MPNKEELVFSIRRKVEDWLPSEQAQNHPWTHLVKLAPDIMQLIVNLSKDIRIDSEARARLNQAIRYFSAPYDYYPEGVIGPIGYLDDIIVSAIVLTQIIETYGTEMVENHWRQPHNILEIIDIALTKGDEMTAPHIVKKLQNEFSRKVY